MLSHSVNAAVSRHAKSLLVHDPPSSGLSLLQDVSADCKSGTVCSTSTSSEMHIHKKKGLSIFVCRLCLYPVAWLVHIWLEVLFIPTTRLVLIQQKLCLHLQVCSHPAEGFVYILRNIRSHPAGYFYTNLNTSSHTLPGQKKEIVTSIFSCEH